MCVEATYSGFLQNTVLDLSLDMLDLLYRFILVGAIDETIKIRSRSQPFMVIFS